MKNPCKEHSGVCEVMKANTAGIEKLENKLDRMEWFIIATLGVSFVGLIFSMAREVSASGH